jgi:hypothetical protein
VVATVVIVAKKQDVPASPALATADA